MIPIWHWIALKRLKCTYITSIRAKKFTTKFYNQQLIYNYIQYLTTLNIDDMQKLSHEILIGKIKTNTLFLVLVLLWLISVIMTFTLLKELLFFKSLPMTVRLLIKTKQSISFQCSYTYKKCFKGLEVESIFIFVC